MPNDTLTKAVLIDNKKTKSRLAIWCWWPMLLGVVAMLAVWLAYCTEHPEFYAKAIHEKIALILTPLAAISFISCAIVYRRPFPMIMSALTTAFFLREWHFAGTSKGVYIALVVIGIWGYITYWVCQIDLCFRGFNGSNYYGTYNWCFFK